MKTRIGPRGGVLHCGRGETCSQCGTQHQEGLTTLPCLRLLAKRLGAIERVLALVGGEIRPCGYCGSPLVGNAKSAEYCRASCRQKAFDLRKRREDGARLCGWPPCGRSLAGRHAQVGYCSQSCKGKQAHYKRKARLLTALFRDVRESAGATTP